MSLQSLIAAGYAAQVMGSGDLGMAIDRAKTMMGADPDLAASMQAEFDRLNSIKDLEKRDFAGAKHRDFLRLVLAP